MNIVQFETLTRRLADRGGSRRTLLRSAAVLALPELRALGSRSARAAEVADAQCAAPPGLVSAYGANRLGQRFKAQHTGRLTQATVYAASASSTNADGYLIEIRNTVRKGKPGTTVLASIQVNDIAKPPIGQTTTVTADFSPGARVEKGKCYALVITTGLAGIAAAPMVNSEAGCAGALFEGRGGDKFAKVIGIDVVFDTLVTKA
jgi:hypothetical protein